MAEGLCSYKIEKLAGNSKIAFMRPMPDVVYLVLSVPAAVLMVTVLSSTRYRAFYNNTMSRMRSILFRM